ncbi:AAA family ATPase [Micromonospora sp. NPDC050397]|uniref:helix-turn-helix transcriptional regulator n=1 Tax=Micromonospora sp. NPDC050397 TaxID=3364279 RepID=UPI00384F7B12
MSRILVGRSGELAALRTAIADPPSIVLVEGEAGVGKSRLIEEALRDFGGRWLLGQCDALREPFPLGPVLDALRDAAVDLPPVRRLSPLLGALVPVLPEIADRLPPALEPLSDQRAERHRLFRAAAAFLDTLGPVTLVLEDLHWSDQGTWEFLAFLGAHPPAGLAIILSRRPGAPLGAPLAESLARSRARPPVRVNVSPLARPETGRLAATLLGTRTLPEAFVAELFERTAGIPFVIEEVLRDLAKRLPAPREPVRDGPDRTPPREPARGASESATPSEPLRSRPTRTPTSELVRGGPTPSEPVRGGPTRTPPSGPVRGDSEDATPTDPTDGWPEYVAGLTVHALAGLAVPNALRDVLTQRLAGLDERDREVLGAAAVLGPVPDERILATMVDADPGEIARALAGALAVGLLHEQEGRCRFRHALARQVVYEALPSPNRRWLHLRAAQALEADRDRNPRPVAQLAHHYRYADLPAEFVRHAEAAADLALGQGDDATAAGYLLEAVVVPELPRSLRVRLAVKLGRAAIEGLAHAEAVPVLTRLLVDDRLPARARGELRLTLGRLLRQQGRAERGYTEIERSLDDLADPGLRARALAILAAPNTAVGRRLDEHLARAEQAGVAARASGDPQAVLAVRSAYTSLELERGAPGAWLLVDELLADPTLIASPREQARACVNLAQAALQAGHLDRATVLLARGQRVVDQSDHPRLAAVVELVGVLVDRAAGRWDGLEDRLRRLLRRGSEFPAADLDVRLNLGTLLVAYGRTDEAEGWLREVVDLARGAGAVWPLIAGRAALARLLLGAGDPAGALAEARRGLELVRDKGIWSWGAETVQVAVEASIGLDRPAEAARLTEELADGLAGTEVPTARARLAQCRGALLRTGDPVAAATPVDPVRGGDPVAAATLVDPVRGGDPVAAAALVDPVRAELARLGLVVEVARLDEIRGDWRCAAPDAAERDRGAQALRDALAVYGTLGAAADVARVCQTMRTRRLAIPYPWRGGRQSYGDALSPREREVATLAARGRTNQEIAVRLCLSRRTVESHVANALRKLGGRSRRELAGLIDRLDLGDNMAETPKKR